MSKLCVYLAAFFVVGLSALASPVQAASLFVGLGATYSGGSEAYGLSGDGSTVVGSSGTAFRWRLATGFEDLPIFTHALDASEDGEVVIGWGHTSFSVSEALLWTASGGSVGLGDLPGGSFSSSAAATSADGDVVVGSSSSAAGGSEAFLWTAAEGMTGLGFLPGASILFSSAADISADASIIVGTAGSPGPASLEPFRWTAAGMIGLGHLRYWSAITQAIAVSADGATIVGTDDPFGLEEAFVWTAAEGMFGLGPETAASDVSGDGSIVIGTVDDGTFDPYGFIWDRVNGLRRLEDVLATDCGIDLGGWRLTSTAAISDDGKTIVGTGINPDNQFEAWIAILDVPEPPAPLLVLGGLAWLARRRRLLGISHSLGGSWHPAPKKAERLSSAQWLSAAHSKNTASMRFDISAERVAWIQRKHRFSSPQTCAAALRRRDR